VVVAAGAAVRSRGEQSPTIDQVSCISRRTFSLLTQVFARRAAASVTY
jgi:hypothetical protein